MAIVAAIAGVVLLAAIVAVAVLVIRTQIIARKAERLMPKTGLFADIEGNRIRYTEAGQGRSILCIHGLGAQLHHFSNTILPDLSKDFHGIAIDRPGSGYSRRASGASARLSEQARIVAAFIRDRRPDRPLIVAHSLGGAVALALAIEHPEMISGLALISPLTRHRETIPDGMRPLYIKSPLKRWLLAQTVSVPMALKYAKPTLDYLFAPQTPGDDYMVAGGGWLGLRPSHIYATGTDFVSIEEDMPWVEKRVGEIKLPVGILFGTADQVLDFTENGTSMIQRLPGIDFVPLQGVGHMPQFVAREEVLAFVRRTAERAFTSMARNDGADDGGRTRTDRSEGF